MRREKKGFDKERKPVWSSQIYTVASTEEYMGQTYYKLNFKDDSGKHTVTRRYSRFEVLKVSDD